MEYQMRNWYYFTWLCGDHIVEQHIHNLDVGNWMRGDSIRSRLKAWAADRFAPAKNTARSSTITLWNTHMLMARRCSASAATWKDAIPKFANTPTARRATLDIDDGGRRIDH